MTNSINRNFIIKFVTFIFFTWTYQKYDNEVSFSEGLKNIYNGGKDSSYTAEYRLLSEQDLKTELYDNELEEYLLNDRDDGMFQFDSNDSLLYDEFPESCSNDLTIYKRHCTRKCPRRTGLRRLYSHCKRKICDEIYRIGEDEIGTRSYNIKLKESIIRKFRKRNIVICSFLLIAILSISYKNVNNLTIFTQTQFLYGILLIILTCTILLPIIYTITKVVKHHRLKAGRSTLSPGQCCISYKDTFPPKRYSGWSLGLGWGSGLGFRP
ncbi:Uncharacterized protein PCOAH_00023300 [Plasmodium coatneyi]|uniref:PIR Superfamily Protein n=1 Tax=Plasmodium coatneyi TaxID=208452 RepID=A0A1B1DYH2_9APIC|nr:Uncharacterized protein PCOAH_00023300 [Plasmodium coatneyi]ANQ07842.1 Uncharacterized protein PCOAH_00023300 [Plasmodium coatneyi]